MSKKIPLIDLKAQYRLIKDEIDEAISSTLNKGQFIGGEEVACFERNFAHFLGVKHTVSCGNGTDALEIALTALGISSGHEVIVPAYTWVATANAVINVGAKPVFCDVDPETYCIDPQKIAPLVNAKTKAIIPVHLYGHPAPMPAIKALAQQYNLKTIEDCAQAHGAEINGKKVGTFGDIGTFSFFPTKNLGALGDGGAIVTNNDDLAQQCFLISNQGQLRKHSHLTTGRNSRLDTLQAAILNVKLQHIDAWTAQRQQVAQWYHQYLQSPQIQKPKVLDDCSHVYHLYVIQTSHRNEMKDWLESHGIVSLIHYPKPLTDLEVFAPQDQIKFPVVNELSRNILSIPMFPELTLDEVVYICDHIDRFFT